MLWIGQEFFLDKAIQELASEHLLKRKTAGLQQLTLVLTWINYRKKPEFSDSASGQEILTQLFLAGQTMKAGLAQSLPWQV